MYTIHYGCNPSVLIHRTLQVAHVYLQTALGVANRHAIFLLPFLRRVFDIAQHLERNITCVK